MEGLVQAFGPTGAILLFIAHSVWQSRKESRPAEIFYASLLDRVKALEEREAKQQEEINSLRDKVRKLEAENSSLRDEIKRTKEPA